MNWDDGLTAEQKKVASHIGCHAVLVAGPGTGKTHTLTRRVIKLCQVDRVEPRQILALAFTRAAAALLKAKVAEALAGMPDFPPACTLHSHALSQLIPSGETLTILPQPLRIADDWEERNIILEDLKAVLHLEIREVRGRFNRLSADWQTLRADGAGATVIMSGTVFGGRPLARRTSSWSGWRNAARGQKGRDSRFTASTDSSTLRSWCLWLLYPDTGRHVALAPEPAPNAALGQCSAQQLVLTPSGDPSRVAARQGFHVRAHPRQLEKGTRDPHFFLPPAGAAASASEWPRPVWIIAQGIAAGWAIALTFPHTIASCS
jgi:hypothetical protein